MSEREQKFEQMLMFVRKAYAERVSKMEALKAEHREKSATFRQLMGEKLMYQNMLDLYKLHGLTED